MPASWLRGSARMAGSTRLVVMSPMPTTSQRSIQVHSRVPATLNSSFECTNITRYCGIFLVVEDHLAFMTPRHYAVRNFVVRELPRHGGRPLRPARIAKSLGLELG